ncbi:hypothetical protein AeNC1_014398 [Aphanomyces euteiches]|nr:hypothetical protein AeNC1_014398 [Aphanomyces euteiches]
MILVKKKSITCEADELELYLAKTGGAWLDDDAAKAVALDEDGKVPDFDVMNPTYSLSNPKCIGVDFKRKDGDIHFLDFDEQWLTEIMTCSELPDLLHLVEKVSGPLRIRIPIANPAGLFAHLNFFERPSVESICQVFEENTAKHCPNVMGRIKQVLFDKKQVSTTEDSFHAFWDNIILDTLVLIFSRKGGYYSWDRNSNKATSTRNYRPDFIFRLNNVCVFRGEEKKPGYHDADVPRKELIDQLEWSYGQAPYVLAIPSVDSNCISMPSFRLLRKSNKTDHARNPEFQSAQQLNWVVLI